MTQTKQTAVITGASHGIGKACALGFARAGWNTVWASRNLSALHAAVAELETSKASVLTVQCDVSKPEQVEALFDEAIGTFGRVDLLFNNAGISVPGGFIDEIPLEAWEQTLAVNLTGAFLCARAAFSRMRKQQPQGGRIINNGSIAAHTPRPRMLPYSVTKHAITGLTKCLALDGREFDIACSQIDIGNVRTEMTAAMVKGMLQANGEYKSEPVFELPQVVEAVLFMASLPPAANVQFITVMATKMPFLGRG